MFYNHSSVRQMSIKFFEISNCIFVYVFKQTREALYTFIYSTEYNKPLNTSIGHIQTTHLKLFKITRKINNQQSTRLFYFHHVIKIISNITNNFLENRFLIMRTWSKSRFRESLILYL